MILKSIRTRVLNVGKTVCHTATNLNLMFKCFSVAA